MIALDDYGAGNLASVRKALAAVGADVWTPSVPGELARARGLIVPGVGHFDATRGMTEDWRAAIRAMVTDGIPVLGICVGLQWLFEGSVEAPDVPGLGIFPGRCALLDGNGADGTPRLKVPHVGWNSLTLPHATRLMAGVPSGTQVYFTHSYAAPITPECVASTTHANSFSSVVERDNLFGVQFHPEKSGEAGLTILRNFLETCR